MLLKNAWNIDDLRKMTKANVPSIFYDFLEGNANSSTTRHNNRADLDRLLLKENLLVGVTDQETDLATDYLGTRHKLPIMLGPVGFAGMYHRKGEVAAGKAADQAGIGQALSTFSICSMEEVAAARNGPLYHQIYVLKNRKLTEDMIARAEKISAKAVILTADCMYGAIHEQDMRNGFYARSLPTPFMLASMLRHPFWCLGAISSGIPQVGNLSPYKDLGFWIMQQIGKPDTVPDQTLSWADLKWLRANWKGRIAIKGIMNPDNARRAVDEGVETILVSNHGGRQLDPTSSSVSILPQVVKAVGGQIEIMFDSGIRRGADIIKAIALGAQAVSLGRAYIYGLGAGGEAGVTRALDLLVREMKPALNLMGFKSLNELRAAGPEALLAAPADLQHLLKTPITTPT